MGKRGPKPWQPTDEERRRIRTYAGLGLSQDTIGTLIGKCADTLVKYCRADLDLGMAEAHAKVGGSIVQMALKGNMTAAIFYAKTQMGWKETERHEHTGKDGAPIQHEQVNADAASFRSRLLSGASGQPPASGTEETQH